MKGFRGFVITLGVVLTIMAFFPGISAFADGSHDDPQTTAGDAASANDQATMRSFVLHAKQHIDDTVAESRSALSALYRDMRAEGIWRQDSVYLIALRLSRDGTSTVANHGKYTKSLYGASLADLPTVKTLLALVLQPGAPGGPVCEQYDMGGSMRWSCAVVYSVCQKTPFSVDFPTEFQTASGFQLFPKPECLTTPLNHPLSPIFGQTSPLPPTKQLIPSAAKLLKQLPQNPV